MPELPDLVYLETKLAEYLSGREILAIKVKQPVVLRILLQEGFEKASPGLALQKYTDMAPS